MRKYLIFIVQPAGFYLDEGRYLYLWFFHPLIVEDHSIKQTSYLLNFNFFFLSSIDA